MRSGIKTVGCLLFLGTVASLTGCTQRIGDFTIISSKNVNVSANRGDRVKGESCVYIILGIPTGVPDLKSAVDKGIENAGPGFDALEDAVLKVKTLFLLFFGQTCYVVEGTAINTKGGKASLDMNRTLLHSSLVQPASQKAAYQKLLNTAPSLKSPDMCTQTSKNS